MLLFLPIRTHAFRERLPIGTLALIAVNLAVFAAQWAGVVDGAAWALTWGEITPVAWLTSNFIHGSIVHVLGNMILLWCVGQILEGTIGPWRLWAVALSIGVVQCALEQVLFLGAEEGGSYGASAMVFGLLVTAAMWAPRSSVETVTMILFRFRRIELSITALASLFLGFEVVYAAAGLFTPSGAVLHLMGALVALPIAYGALRLGLVDCGGWDFLSLRERAKQEHAEAIRAERDALAARSRRKGRPADRDLRW